MKEKTKLFCIPYAGGSANLYNKWAQTLSKDIELVPLELAGRGTRISEGFYKNLEVAVDDIFNQIVDHIYDSNYAFFGHSLGAFLVYELTQKIMSLNLPLPKHIFFSGRRSPGSPR